MGFQNCGKQVGKKNNSDKISIDSNEITASKVSTSRSTFNVNGGNGKVYVKTYSYSPYDGPNKHHPIFKYADLINRAILYKDAYPDDEEIIYINMAIYKVAKKVWIGVDPTADTYAWVGSSDFGDKGAGTEKFLWTVRRAHKREGIKIRFIYHNPGSDKEFLIT